MMNAKAPPHAFFPSRPPGIFVRGFYFYLQHISSICHEANVSIARTHGVYEMV